MSTASVRPRVWLPADSPAWKRNVLIATTIVLLVSGIAFVTFQQKQKPIPTLAVQGPLPDTLYVDRVRQFSIKVPAGWGRSANNGPVCHYRDLFLTLNNRGMNRLVIQNESSGQTPEAIYDGLPLDILYCEFSYWGFPQFQMPSERVRAFTSIASVLSRTEYLRRASINEIIFKRNGRDYRILIIAKGEVPDSDKDKAWEMIHTLRFHEDEYERRNGTF